MSISRSEITTLTQTVGQAGNLLSVQEMISYIMALGWGGGRGETAHYWYNYIKFKLLNGNFFLIKEKKEV